LPSAIAESPSQLRTTADYGSTWRAQSWRYDRSRKVRAAI
jgi:hypothetical protein